MSDSDTNSLDLNLPRFSLAFARAAADLAGDTLVDVVVVVVVLGDVDRTGADVGGLFFLLVDSSRFSCASRADIFFFAAAPPVVV